MNGQVVVVTGASAGIGRACARAFAARGDSVGASVFRLGDGTVVHGPATADQPVFGTRVRDEMVQVRQPGAG